MKSMRAHKNSKTGSGSYPSLEQYVSSKKKFVTLHQMAAQGNFHGHQFSRQNFLKIGRRHGHLATLGLTCEKA